MSFLITSIHICTVGSDDGHEVLLAAANAVTNTGIIHFDVLFLSHSTCFFLAIISGIGCSPSPLQPILGEDGASISVYH